MPNCSAVCEDAPVAIEDPIVLFRTSTMPVTVTYIFFDRGQQYGLSGSLRLKETMVLPSF
jgi:hypothetical protein